MTMKRIFALLPVLCALASAPASAQVKISQLPAASVPLGCEFVPVVQVGVTSAVKACDLGIPVAATSAPTPDVTFQEWWNVSTSPATKEMWDGSQWVPEGTLNPSTHVYTAAVCSSSGIGCINAITGFGYAGTTGGTTGNLVGSASPVFTGTANFFALTATGSIEADSAGSASAPPITIGGTSAGLYAVNANEPCIATNGLTALCVTPSQQTLIGQTNPIQVGTVNSQFQNMGTTNSNSGNAFGRFSANAQGPNLYCIKSRNTTVALGVAVNAGDSICGMLGYGDDGSTAGGALSSEIMMKAMGTIGTGIVPGSIYFYTANSSGALTQALELDDAQNATFSGTISAVGQQTAQGLTTTSPGWYAQVTGDSMARLRLGLNSTDVASISAGSGSANRDAFFERAAAADWRFGAPDAAAPVAQTTSVQNVVAGTSNTAGTVWDFNDSAGTGSGASGGFAWYNHPAGSSGSSQNAAAVAMALSGAGVLSVGGSQVPTVGATNVFTNTNTFNSETIFGNFNTISGTTGILADSVIAAPSGGTGSTANAYQLIIAPKLEPGVYSGNACNTVTGANCAFALALDVNAVLAGAGTTTLSFVGNICNLSIDNGFTGTVANSFCFEAGDLAPGTSGILPTDYYQFFGVVSTLYNGLTSGSHFFRGLDLGCSSAAVGAGGTLDIECAHIDLATGSSAGNSEYGFTITNNCPATTATCWAFYLSSTAPNYFAGSLVEGSGRANEGAGSINATTIYEADTALGTAALVNTGTSGATLGLLNGNLTFGGTDSFTGVLTVAAGSTSAPGLIGGTSGTGIDIGSASITDAIAGVAVTTLSANTYSVAGAATLATLVLDNLNTGSPVAANLGSLNFQGDNLTPAAVNFCRIIGGSTNVTAGAELGDLIFQCEGGTGTAGTNATMFTLAGSGVTPTATFGAGVKVVSAFTRQDSTLFSAAGTALPSCTTAAKGTYATVSDATSPTYGSTYSSGGAVVAPVMCNGTNWTMH